MPQQLHSHGSVLIGRTKILLDSQFSLLLKSRRKQSNAKSIRSSNKMAKTSSAKHMQRINRSVQLRQKVNGKNKS